MLESIQQGKLIDEDGPQCEPPGVDQALGAALAARDVPMVAADRGYTTSHTVLIASTPLGEASELGRRLDEANIIVTAIQLPAQLGGEGLRVGVAETTRRGADEPLMPDVAQAIADVLLSRQPPEQVRSRVRSVAAHLSSFRFSAPL